MLLNARKICVFLKNNYIITNTQFNKFLFSILTVKQLKLQYRLFKLDFISFIDPLQNIFLIIPHCLKSVHIWSYSGSHFSGLFRICSEYREIRSITPYSVQMRENTGKMRSRITPNMDTFYAVSLAIPSPALSAPCFSK